MKIIKLEGDFAQVESGRLLRKANIQMLPGLKIGDFVLVHAGFAIQKVDPQRARETLKIIEDIPGIISKRKNKRLNLRK
jgi:hydrogenase expression/formation protein HypC